MSDVFYIRDILQSIKFYVVTNLSLYLVNYSYLKRLSFILNFCFITYYRGMFSFFTVFVHKKKKKKN